MFSKEIVGGHIMFSKLIVDRKTVYVFEDSKLPNWINRLSHMTGVEIKKANEADRIPFRQLEDKLWKQRKSNEKY